MIPILISQDILQSKAIQLSRFNPLGEAMEHVYSGEKSGGMIGESRVCIINTMYGRRLATSAIL